MSAPWIPIVRHPQAAGDHLPFDPDEYERFIKAVEDARIVEHVDGRWGADWELAARVVPAHIPRLRDALFAAAGNPLLRQPSAVAAGAGDVAEAIRKATQYLGKPQEIVEHILAIVDGDHTQVDWRWWGVMIAMDNTAASALGKLAAQDVTAILGALTVFVHAAAPISGVAAAVGGALGTWVNVANRAQKGINLKLYGWTIPWIESRP